MLPYLIDSINQLEKAGADFIVMPCNTLHSLLLLLRSNSKLKIIDLIETVSKEIENKYKTIAIFCTLKTREDLLYDNYLKKCKILYPNRSEQKEISKIIVRIIRRKATLKDKKYLEGLTEKLVKKGAERVLLACTDLSILVGRNKITLDSTEILIKYIHKHMKS